MKPIIIYATEYDGKITIDKTVFEKAIADAYEQGKADAQSFNAIWTTEQPKYLPDYYNTLTTAPRTPSPASIAYRTS